ERGRGFQSGEGDAVAFRDAEPGDERRWGSGELPSAGDRRGSVDGRAAGGMAERGSEDAVDQRVWADGDGGRVLCVRGGGRRQRARGRGDRAADWGHATGPY